MRGTHCSKRSVRGKNCIVAFVRINCWFVSSTISNTDSRICKFVCSNVPATAPNTHPIVWWVQRGVVQVFHEELPSLGCGRGGLGGGLTLVMQYRMKWCSRRNRELQDGVTPMERVDPNPDLAIATQELIG